MKSSLTLLFLYSVQAWNELCVHHNKSCASQLWKDPHEDLCQMVYYEPNSYQCYDKQFQSDSEPVDFGIINLQAYVDEVSRTAFNLTFYHIKWKVLQMRFKHPPKMSMCKDFYIDVNTSISHDASLYYDCPWSLDSSEGLEADFEYTYGISDVYSTRKFRFFIPKHEALESINPLKLELFLYVEVTNLNNLILKIQIPPLKHKITDYYILVIQKRGNQTKIKDERIVSNSMAKRRIIDFSCTTCSGHGQYYFTVTPFIENDVKITFATSYTPKITIPSTGKKTGLVVGIVGVSTLIPVILFITYMLQRYHIKNPNDNVLFVYSASHDVHVKLVSTFTKILKDVYKMNIKLDIFDIPLTPLKDPFDWLTETFFNATHIIFFISPDSMGVSTSNIYKDLDNLALRLMKEEYTRKSSNKQFMLVTLPYSNKNIPVEVCNLKQYNFPEDLNKFLNRIQNKKRWHQDAERAGVLKFMKSEIKIAEKEVLENCISEIIYSSKDVTSTIVDPQEDENLLISSVTEKSNDGKFLNHPYTFKVGTLNLLGCQGDNNENTENSLDSTTTRNHVVNVHRLNI